MEVKRLFIATFVARNLFERTYSKIQSTFDGHCHGKWTELENLHFTYKFLGNVEVEKIAEIKDLLKSNLKEFTGIIKYNGIGVLRSPQKPSILYARVYSPDKIVLDNFTQIEKTLIKYGFPKERQKFLPHVTMLRIKGHEEGFADVFEINKDNYIGKQVGFKISLVSSTLTHDGPIYEIIS